MEVVLVRSALLAGLATLAACSFDGRIGPGFQCAPGDRCPAGQTCVDGVCVASDGGVDDAGPDGGLPSARCGLLTLLQDDFEAGEIGPLWWPWNEAGVSIDVTGGHAVIDIDAGTGAGWGGLTSTFYYDFHEGVIEAEITEVGGRYAVVEARAHTGERAQILVEETAPGQRELIAGVYRTPTPGVRAAIPYVPAAHRFWRLRAADGRIHWEYSADRVQWSELHREAAPFPVDHVRGILAGGGQRATATRIRFADVNAAAPAGLRFCPAASFRDDFAAPPLDPLWDDWRSAGCTVQEADGVLRMTFDGDGNDWCGIHSAHLLDLQGSSFAIDARDAPGVPYFQTYIEVANPRARDDYLLIGREAGQWVAEQVVGGSAVSTRGLAYQADAHRWWQLRGDDDGQVFFETSPDGASWTARWDAPAMFDLSQVYIAIGAGHWPPGPGSVVTVEVPDVHAAP
jgi:hypothetical protein